MWFELVYEAYVYVMDGKRIFMFTILVQSVYIVSKNPSTDSENLLPFKNYYQFMSLGACNPICTKEVEKFV